MTQPWSAPRPWKGKTCNIELSECYNGEPMAYITRPDHPDRFVVFARIEDSPIPDPGVTLVHTDPRDAQYAPLARLMGVGKANGLDDRRDHLAGRCVTAQAISLAVHLGASRICLTGTAAITDRDRRNLETMVRPLKSRRVDVWAPEGHTPFATEPR